jgi:hypothetical protein
MKNTPYGPFDREESDKTVLPRKYLNLKFLGEEMTQLPEDRTFNRRLRSRMLRNRPDERGSGA